MIEKMDIIIPTWNSMPELEKCLESVTRYIPEQYRGDIIIVDRYSADGTIETAEKYGCKILYDDISLGSARMKGIKEAKTEWIIFIDSDIYITPEWFSTMMYYRPRLYRAGMFYGYTLSMHPKQKRLIEWKAKSGVGRTNFAKLKKGQRGYTHNTFILRKLLLDLDISDINAWEDWVITQHIINKGYNVYRLPIYVNHDDWHHLNPDGSFKTAWNGAGIRKVASKYGFNFEMFAFLNFYLITGVRATIALKDLWYLKSHIKQWVEAWKGFLGIRRNFARVKL